MYSMEVSVLSHTPNADRLACATARGDYMDDSLANVDISDNTDYADVMEGVSIRDHHQDATSDSWWDDELYRKTRSFIEELLQRGHFGPFEHPQITFAVEGVSRACMAQITRHRHATFDVQSMRYVNFEDAEFTYPDSTEDVVVSSDSDIGDETAGERMWWDYQRSLNTYQRLVDEGVPEEDARMVLPIGTKVNLTMTINLRSLFHVIDMRHAGDAQDEIMQLAKKFMDEAEKVAPISMEEYREHAKGASKKAP